MNFFSSPQAETRAETECRMAMKPAWTAEGLALPAKLALEAADIMRLIHMATLTAYQTVQHLIRTRNGLAFQVCPEDAEESQAVLLTILPKVKHLAARAAELSILATNNRFAQQQDAKK